MSAGRMLVKAATLAALLVLLGTLAYAADCNNGGRYEDILDGTVQDCRTGLIWLRDANCVANIGGINKTGALHWREALAWVAALGGSSCGLTDGSWPGDWRLPTKTEFMAMVAYARSVGYSSPALTNAAGDGHWVAGDPFLNVQSTNHWTSTGYNAFVSGWIWLINMANGQSNINGSPSDSGATAHVWPVRAGQAGEFGNVTIQ